MNETQLYDGNTTEIKISDVFWSIIKSWRAILITMLVFGVILGGYAFYKEFKDYKDPEKRQKSQEAYDLAVEDYERKKEKLETEIENSKKLQERLEDFKEKGIYLKVDPFNLYKIEATYFIDSNYEIMPNVTYQNPNNLISLIRSYRTAISRINYEDLIDMNGEDLTLISPVGVFSTGDIYSLSVDESAGFLQLTIVGDTKERAVKIQNKIENVIDENHKLLTTVIGEHSIEKVSEFARYTVDYNWETLQRNFTNNQYDKNIETI